MANFSGTISGTITGLPEGSVSINVTLTNASAPGQRDLITTATTAAALTIPANTLFILIIPPAGNTVTPFICGSAIGTGTTLHPTTPSLIPVVSASSSCFLGSLVSAITGAQVDYI